MSVFTKATRARPPSRLGGQPSPDPLGILGLDGRRIIGGMPPRPLKTLFRVAGATPPLLILYPPSEPRPLRDLGAGSGRKKSQKKDYGTNSEIYLPLAIGLCCVSVLCCSPAIFEKLGLKV